MSIDFDSNALQTQHEEEEEEEYDQEDYAREQELHKLLTDLPDDMLEDSRDSSLAELDDSPCGNHGNTNRPQHVRNGQTQWTNQQRPPITEETYLDNYEDEGSYHQDYSYENGHAPLPQGGREGYPYSSMGLEESSCTNDFSTERGYEQEPYSPSKLSNNVPNYNQHRNHFQNVDGGGTAETADHYKATYQPHQPVQMFNPESLQNGHLQNGLHENGLHQNGLHQNGHFEQLQREFLDSRQNTQEGQQLAQLQVLHQAQARQLEEQELKQDDGKRRIRFLEHQLAIVKDEKEGLAVTLKESSRVLEENQSREAQLQASLKTLEHQIHTLTERDQESQKKQRVAEAAVASLQQQMMEMCRSDTLTRTREQHDRDLHTVREQHDARVLSLQQMLDTHTHALQEQTELGQRLREQVRQLERQREEEHVERASVINALTKRLEDSQKQCAKLLHAGGVQEMTRMQMRLQQAQSAKTMSEEMNKALQEELNDLKDQIRLYDAAVKHKAISLDSGGDWDNQLSDSYAQLGIKKVNWKNAHLHSTPAQGQGEGVDGGEVVRELRAELQRSLASLKDKRQRISQLQQDLHTSQDQLQQLQHDSTHSSTKLSPKPPEAVDRLAAAVAASPSELALLQEERQHLQDKVEALERRNKEMKLGEEKVKAANSELCSKMREMIQELDQEKQEAEKRHERTQQQFRDDVVMRVRSELTQQHQAQMEELRAQQQQQTQDLEAKLCEVQEEMGAVQECYISVCKEKSRLEEVLTNRAEEETKTQLQSERAVEQLRADLQCEHQGELSRLRSQWEGELQERIQSSVSSAKLSWQQEKEEVEQAWSLRLERAVEEERRLRAALTQEGSCQTEVPGVSREEVEAQLQEQRERLQRETQEQRERRQREAQEEQVAAVEEAVKRTHRELQQKHLKEVARHMEGALSRAHGRWLEELPTHPEYRASLQAERSQWDREQVQHTHTQISAAVKAAEDQWQESVQADRAELERSRETIGQLQEEVRSLQEEVRSLGAQLELSQEQQETLMGVELAAARAAWTREQQEETSRLQNQHQNQLDQQRAQLEQNLQQGSEEKLRRVLKETQERHENKILQIHQDSSAECSGGRCVSKHCSETSARLQKKSHELQKHLEKACRQLQQMARDHRTAMHTLTEEHEEVLRQEREARAKAVEEAQRSAQDAAHGDQRSLQAGLEEMKEQYTGAVEKIRGDMLRYLQDSKERAAELIRVEVQQERQETTRRMRRYYLACLQELLKDGGHSNGAEKKIINAASKLAAMAKVLETPVTKKKLSKSPTAQGWSSAGETNSSSLPAQTPRLPCGLAPASESRDPVGGRPQDPASLRGAPVSSTDPNGRVSAPHRAQPSERLKESKPSAQRSQALLSQKPPIEGAPLPSSSSSSSSSHGGYLSGAGIGDVSLTHVTLRSQRRERHPPQQHPQHPRRTGSDPGRPTGEPYPQAETHRTQEHSFTQEPPVRDGSTGSYLLPHTHTLTSSSSSYLPAHTHTLSSSTGSYLPAHTHSPEVDLFRPLSALGPEFDTCSSFLGESSDSTIYREIVKATKLPLEAGQGPGGRGRLGSKSLFSEMPGFHKDSGFDSPPSQLRKRPT
ncbi:centrosomal protein of 152 kDa isoform X2 [Clupea harengus]|uniref:Centrosomal protein of 152 kDa isoform X2 n=1 Tax=Clupea harengus TaxID=7950 RepID=A0A6P8F9V7_CLUHA|nr:centrosomal protein of 152 kDa isoform X2 [Clupea harengus]XP_031420569.1 centrosomal protein of 152 kDa isoform X2 [Clupea harengus]XP_031420570.1 centrosomal protein of 152 kDa isoform X2 [Clupea harengus]